jgi:hypothetical protein
LLIRSNQSDLQRFTRCIVLVTCIVLHCTGSITKYTLPVLVLVIKGPILSTWCCHQPATFASVPGQRSSSLSAHPTLVVSSILHQRHTTSFTLRNATQSLTGSDQSSPQRVRTTTKRLGSLERPELGTLRVIVIAAHPFDFDHNSSSDLRCHYPIPPRPH